MVFKLIIQINSLTWKPVCSKENTAKNFNNFQELINVKHKEIFCLGKQESWRSITFASYLYSSHENKTQFFCSLAMSSEKHCFMTGQVGRRPGRLSLI